MNDKIYKVLILETDKRIRALEKKSDDLDNKFTDRHILTNDRINEAFNIIRILERKTSR